MEPLTVLNDLRIASPCPASWDAMRGDDRVRFCDSCSKHVYNVSGLTADAAVALVRESEGHLCVRLYRRKDGTVLTADCPVGLKSALRRRLIRLATAGVVVFAMLRSGIWLFAETGPRVGAPTAPHWPRRDVHRLGRLGGRRPGDQEALLQPGHRGGDLPSSAHRAHLRPPIAPPRLPADDP